MREDEQSTILKTLREVQAIEMLRFAEDVAPAAAADAAAAAVPVEVEIDWGDLLEVDTPAIAAASSSSSSAAAAAAAGGVEDIDWTVLSAADGCGAEIATEISWDFDVEAGGEGGEYVVAAGGEDDYGISISTDGVGGKANVFEDPERCCWECGLRVERHISHTSHVTRHTSLVTHHTSHVRLIIYSPLQAYTAPG